MTFAQPLFQAIADNDLDALKALFDQGADPNQGIDRAVGFFPLRIENPHGPNHHLLSLFLRESFIPAMLAAALGRADALKLLLERGADPNRQGAIFEKTPSPTAWTPLAFACSQSHVDCVRVLLEHGAATQPGPTGRSPLMLAARAGSTEVMDAIFQVDPASTRQADHSWSGECWATLAAQAGSLPALDFALRHSSTARIQELTRSALLHHAAGSGSVACVARCLEFCDPNLPLPSTPMLPTTGWSAAMLAACKGHADALELLAAATDLSIATIDADGGGLVGSPPGAQALGLAAFSKHDRSECIAILLRHGADPAHRDSLGQTPLMRSCMSHSFPYSWPHPANARALLKASPVDAQDHDGLTAAMHCLSLHRIDIEHDGPSPFDDPRVEWLAGLANPALPDAHGRDLFEHIRIAQSHDEHGDGLASHFARKALAVIEARELGRHVHHTEAHPPRPRL